MTSAASDDRTPVVEADTQTADPPPAPRLELGAQILLFALSIAIVVNSLSLGLMVTLGPGAGFFPFFLGIGLGVLTIAWFLQSRRIRRGSPAHTEPAHTEPAHTEPAPAEPAHAGADTAAIERKHIVDVIVSLLVLAVLMIPLGFQLPMFLFIVYHLWFRAHRRWYTVLIIALAGSIGVFHVFNDLLMVALPYSNVEFLNLIGL